MLCEEGGSELAAGAKWKIFSNQGAEQQGKLHISLLYTCLLYETPLPHLLLLL